MIWSPVNIVAQQIVLSPFLTCSASARFFSIFSGSVHVAFSVRCPIASETVCGGIDSA